MIRPCALVVAWTALFSLPLQAAEVTRVASSFDDDDPFDLYLDVGFERTQRRMLLSREFVNADGKVAYNPELRYAGVDTRINFDAHIGVWKDFEFAVGIPFVFAIDETWGFARGTTEANSTLINNCLTPSGDLVDPACRPDAPNGAVPIVDLEDGKAAAYRGGLGNLRFGLKYAFFNQRKDDTKPIWVVGFDYEAPTAKLLDPTVRTSRDAATGGRGGFGDRHHRYTLWSAFSRRMGIAEPYYKAYYTLPFKGPGFYSNCRHPDEGVGYPINCDFTRTDTPWDRYNTAIQAPHQMGMVFGSEFQFYNMPEKAQAASFDVRTVVDYVSAGRYYNEMSGLLKKLLWTGDYLKFGGMIGLHALASDYVSVRVNTTLLYNTEHYLTDEPVGIDGDDDGDTVNFDDPSSVENNPNFDYRVDTPSNRIKASELWEFRLDLTATFSF